MQPRDRRGVGDRPKERDPAPPNGRGGSGLDADVRTPRRREVCHMITVESLARRYAGFTAVDNVSFTAQPGRVPGFLGPSGAGKSTPMRVTAGRTAPTSGS